VHKIKKEKAGLEVFGPDHGGEEVDKEAEGDHSHEKVFHKIKFW
jgi:hypothetical protein